MNRYSAWHVLGPGAMGCLWAANLARAGLAVTLLARDAARYPGHVTVWNGDVPEQIPVEVADATASGPAIGNLLVAVKAHDTVAALTPLTPRLTPDTLIVLMQNGLGVPEVLAQAGIPGRVVQAFTTEGAWRSAPFQVVYAGRGRTLLPDFDADAIGALGSGTMAVAADPAIGRRLWLKLAVNCVINPVTALAGCINGEIAEMPDLVHDLCHEIASVLEVEGVAVPVEALADEVIEVARATASNRSSMLQDLDAGRTTEIHFITGHLLRTGQRHGLELPLNRQLLTLMLVRQRAGLGAVLSRRRPEPQGG